MEMMEGREMNMKKNLYTILAAAAVFAGCTETTGVDPEEYVISKSLPICRLVQ